MSTVVGALHEVQRASTRISAVVRPATWLEALLAFEEHPSARPISGGTDLLVDLARSSGEPVTLIDLSSVHRGRDIDDIGDAFLLGGGVTHNQVIADPRVKAHCLPLAQACLEIGSPQLRNRATVAGNLATASPANDSISALMALDAKVVLTRLVNGDETSREVDLTRFFTGSRSTICERHELITAIRVPKLGDDDHAIWFKVGLRRAQAISVVHAGMVVTTRDDVVTRARLSIGSVAATVIESHVFPAALVGKHLDDDTIAATARSVAASIEPIDDVRATADYRRQVTQTVLARALHAIADDATDAAWPADPPLLGVRTPSMPPPNAIVTDEDTIEMTLNGWPAAGFDAAGATLLDWLRDHSSVECAGVKEGCAEGECGACTVRLDGAAVMSCLVSAAQADGSDVQTVEGLSPAEPAGELHPLQSSFIDEFAVQCGFCIPGLLVAGAALLDECASPTDEQIELGLAGNLCRCTGYYPISQAVRSAGRAQ